MQIICKADEPQDRPAPGLPVTPAAAVERPSPPANTTMPKRSWRSALVRQVTLWHWVSSGITLGGMVLFTVTGITLNHAAEIKAEPRVQVREAAAPAAVAAALRAAPGGSEGRHPLPAAAIQWLTREFGSSGDGTGEWSPGELYVSLPRPGGDAWVTVELASGVAHYERTDRGWIAYLNDLHKGRHTGRAWSIYIDVLAAACLVFSFTGLILLQIHAAKRPATWPLIGFSLVAPFLVLALLAHF